MLDELNGIRAENARMLEQGISGIDFITPQKVLDGCNRVYSYHYARYDSQKAKNVSLYTFLKALSAEGLTVGSCGYGKLHIQPLYEGSGPYAEGAPFYSPALNIEYMPTPAGELANSERLGDSAFMMAPRFEKCGADVVKLYIEAYTKIAENLDELVEYERANGLTEKKIENKGTSINLFR